MKYLNRGTGPNKDKAIHLTHLESKTGHPAPLANRLGFAAGGKSSRAHVAGEHLAATPSAPSLPTSLSRGGDWLLERSGEGGRASRWWGNLAGWGGWL